MTAKERADEVMKDADWVSAQPQLWTNTPSTMRSTLCALICDAILAAQSAEREACARLAMNWEPEVLTPETDVAAEIAKAIRTRTGDLKQ